jgi:hypothetical protein
VKKKFRVVLCTFNLGYYNSAKSVFMSQTNSHQSLACLSPHFFSSFFPLQTSLFSLHILFLSSVCYFQIKVPDAFPEGRKYCGRECKLFPIKVSIGVKAYFLHPIRGSFNHI